MKAITQAFAAATFALGIAAAPMTAPAQAQSSYPQELVEKSRITIEKMRSDSDFPTLPDLIARSKGVIVFPSLLKAGFIVGGEGGSGVLLTRGSGGQWSAPAFITMGSGSVGLQIGAQDAEVVLVIMTDKGLEQVLKNEFKLGADASIAVGPIGAGAEAATTLAAGADMYAFSKTRGLFAGGSLEGSVLKERADYNREYYGRNVTAREIVMSRSVTNTNAQPLQTALAKR